MDGFKNRGEVPAGLLYRDPRVVESLPDSLPDMESQCLGVTPLWQPIVRPTTHLKLGQFIYQLDC